MSVPGKLEATIKISELPTAETVENGWQQFKMGFFALTLKKAWSTIRRLRLMPDVTV